MATRRTTRSTTAAPEASEPLTDTVVGNFNDDLTGEFLEDNGSPDLDDGVGDILPVEPAPAVATTDAFDARPSINDPAPGFMPLMVTPKLVRLMHGDNVAHVPESVADQLVRCGWRYAAAIDA